MKIGTLFTVPLEDHDGVEGGGIGQFELEVTVDDTLFKNSGDKLGLVKSTLSYWAANAIHDTKVPAEYWLCETALEIAKAFNLPRRFSFKRT